MLYETEGSTVPRRELGSLLTQLREEASLTLDAAAEALDCSRQKIWRIEKGLVPLRIVDGRVLCERYGVSDELTEIVLGLAKATRAKGWWHSYGDAVPAWFSLYVGLEERAREIRHYNGELIPGLLQTREYAAELFRRKNPRMTAAELEKLVAVRLQRQLLLARRLPPAPTLRVMLSEAVLRRPALDRAGMGDQLRHLLEAGVRENISVRVLPLAVGPSLASETGNFVILGFPANFGRIATEPTTIYVEGITGALYLDRPAEVTAYEHAWSDLEVRTLDERESAEMIAEIIGECYA